MMCWCLWQGWRCPHHCYRRAGRMSMYNRPLRQRDKMNKIVNGELWGQLTPVLGTYRVPRGGLIFQGPIFCDVHPKKMKWPRPTMFTSFFGWSQGLTTTKVKILDFSLAGKTCCAFDCKPNRIFAMWRQSDKNWRKEDRYRLHKWFVCINIKDSFCNKLDEVLIRIYAMQNLWV